VVILIGGGFALAKGFQDTGLSTWCGERLGLLGSVSPLVLLLVVCLLMTFLTELTSNTATAEMALPILAAAAIAMQVNPLLLMLPATLNASFAFMLPVATPPNAMVFGTGRLKVRQMARSGLWLNFAGVAIVALVTEAWGSRCSVGSDAPAGLGGQAMSRPAHGFRHAAPPRLIDLPDQFFGRTVIDEHAIRRGQHRRQVGLGRCAGGPRIRRNRGTRPAVAAAPRARP